MQLQNSRDTVLHIERMKNLLWHICNKKTRMASQNDFLLMSLLVTDMGICTNTSE